MLSKSKIKEFARDVLGCHCPDEVFEHIVWEDRSESGVEGTLLRINIGHRLLIYIADCGPEDGLDGLIVSLVDTGLQERDSLGFNRFRLVLCCDVPKRLEGKAQVAFASLSTDEKTHLHVIKKSEWPVGNGE